MHCHSPVNVRGWSVQCRVAVRPVRSVPSGSATGTPGYAQARVAVRPGTLEAEWQCDRRARVRSGPSGSAGHTAKWRRACRNGTLRVEWQCVRYAQGRVAVRPGTLEAEWQCGSHCHSPVNVWGWGVQCRVAVRPVRSVPSGSATGAPGYAQCRVAVRVTLPSGVERAATVRSGPSGSVTDTLGYAQTRVAVQVTLPSGVERTVAVRSGSSGSATGTLEAEWQCGSHCHSPVNVRGWSVQCRVAVRPVCSGVVWQRMPGCALDLSRGWPFTRGISWQAGGFLN